MLGLGVVGETVGKLFGTDKAAAALIDNVSRGLDKLIYTDEEKSDSKAASVTEARQMVINWLDATSGQHLARRLLAIMITVVWLMQYVFMIAMSTMAVWVEKPARFVASADVVAGYAETMKGAVMLILAFYFASPYMGNVVDVALKKFGGKKQ
jgi:hypothetical protein